MYRNVERHSKTFISFGQFGVGIGKKKFRKYRNKQIIWKKNQISLVALVTSIGMARKALDGLLASNSAYICISACFSLCVYLSLYVHAFIFICVCVHICPYMYGHFYYGHRT